MDRYQWPCSNEAAERSESVDVLRFEMGGHRSGFLALQTLQKCPFYSASFLVCSFSILSLQDGQQAYER